MRVDGRMIRCTTKHAEKNQMIRQALANHQRAPRTQGAKVYDAIQHAKVSQCAGSRR